MSERETVLLNAVDRAIISTIDHDQHHELAKAASELMAFLFSRPAPVYAWAVKGPEGIEVDAIWKEKYEVERVVRHSNLNARGFRAVRVEVREVEE